MEEFELKITDLVTLRAYRYDSIPTALYLEYVERSPDHWYSDNTTQVEIDKDMAKKIRAFLRNYLAIEGDEHERT